jgi:uncharacterized protein (DUF2141 family)
MPTGRATAYDLTVGVVVNMDEAIYMLSPQDTPMLTGLGSDGLTMIGQSPVDEIQFDWMTDSILTPRSTLNGAATTGDAVITVATGDRTKFSTGDIVTIGKQNAVEQIRVTGYSSGTDVLNVSRAWAGTATNYASGAIVVGIGTALAEGSDPEAARTVDRVQVSNVTQIFGPTKVDLSRTEQQVRKYGVGNEFTHQLTGRMTENAISREQTFLYGARVNSTTLKVRTTGGLRYFITTNVDTSATSLTVAVITTKQQTGYNAGGFADVVMANPVALADLNAAADTLVVRTTIDDPKRGRTRVTFVDTEFGSVLLARNRWCLPMDAFGISRENVIRRVMQPLIFERLAKTGDSDQGQIVCEEGLEVKGEQHLFRFNNLAYTGSV